MTGHKTERLRNIRDGRRYEEIQARNLNKPMSQLVCPRCEGTNIEQDKEYGSDHPGVFGCKDCFECFCA